jgi:hypothetical protein
VYQMDFYKTQRNDQNCPRNKVYLLDRFVERFEKSIPWVARQSTRMPHMSILRPSSGYSNAESQDQEDMGVFSESRADLLFKSGGSANTPRSISPHCGSGGIAEQMKAASYSKLWNLESLSIPLDPRLRLLPSACKCVGPRQPLP